MAKDWYLPAELGFRNTFSESGVVCLTRLVTKLEKMTNRNEL